MLYTYPDVSVVCGKPLVADERQDILLNPVLIFEVLSPSSDTWTLQDHDTLQAELKIDSIGVSLPLSRIYDRVELPAA